MEVGVEPERLEVLSGTCESLVASANHLVADRFGNRYFCEAFSIAMAVPTIQNFEVPKRRGRYSKDRFRLVQGHWQFTASLALVVFIDASLAGDVVVLGCQLGDGL